MFCLETNLINNLLNLRIRYAVVAVIDLEFPRTDTIKHDSP